MKNLSFKKAVLISTLGHIAVFGIFNLSFGKKIDQFYYADVSFLGAFLRSYDFRLDSRFNSSFLRHQKIIPLVKGNKKYSLVKSNYYLKPASNLTLNSDKIILTAQENTILKPPRRKETVAIMFYPALPYHFLLYFRDRQVAHIELMFKVLDNRTNSIMIKRKISSGNLEADLLSMRYISRYIFMQQTKFTNHDWQTVKIELSAKNNK